MDRELQGLPFLGCGRVFVCLNRVSLCSPGTRIVDQDGHELRDPVSVS